MSPLMGLFEKRRAKGFFEFIQAYDFKNPATQKGRFDEYIFSVGTEEEG